MGTAKGNEGAASGGPAAITAERLREARGILGERWGYGRPLSMSEMGILIGLKGRNPGASIRDMERGHDNITPRVAALVESLLAGQEPDPRPS